MSDEQLRISDAEREQAAADLGEHYAQGRLTAEEHAERLDQIWAARTRAELAAGLPRPARTRPRRTTDGRPRRASGRTGGGVAPPGCRSLVVLAVLVVLTVLTHLPFLRRRLWSRLRRRRGATGSAAPPERHWSR